MLQMLSVNFYSFNLSINFKINGSNLAWPETEGCCSGVRLLSVQQYQTIVLCLTQVVTGGEMAEAEGLTPSDVTPAPATIQEKDSPVSMHLFHFPHNPLNMSC